MKKNRVRLFSRMALAVGIASAAFSQSPDFHIYLGFGQSNMEGGPKVSGLPQVDSRFQVLAAMNCPSLNPARTMGQWYPANPPLPRCSAGPGIVDWFGRTLVDSLPSQIKIGVIVVTIVGTKIEVFDKATVQSYLNDKATEDWLRNYAKDYGNNPYGRLVDMAKIAQKSGVIKGILLHQGESNVGDAQWPEKVKKIYGDFMADLGLNPKDVPLLAGEVVNADMNGEAAGINEQIKRLPSVLPNSYVISSSKLPAGNDRMHFTADGHKLFGLRYANTMLSILNKTTSVNAIPSQQAGFSIGPLHRANGRQSASIEFTVPRPSRVSLKVFTPQGREIAEWANQDFSSGTHRLTVPSPVPSGLILLRLAADHVVLSRKSWVD
jgi:Carbohydrate esterase, sialic acid-specific acetylesterase